MIRTLTRVDSVVFSPCDRKLGTCNGMRVPASIPWFIVDLLPVKSACPIMLHSVGPGTEGELLQGWAEGDGAVSFTKDGQWMHAGGQGVNGDNGDSDMVTDYHVADLEPGRPRKRGSPPKLRGNVGRRSSYAPQSKRECPIDPSIACYSARAHISRRGSTHSRSRCPLRIPPACRPGLLSC